MNPWDVDIELWQRGNGKWTWVMFNRPDPLQPPSMTLDTTEFEDPHACLADAEVVVARSSPEVVFVYS